MKYLSVFIFLCMYSCSQKTAEQHALSDTSNQTVRRTTEQDTLKTLDSISPETADGINEAMLVKHIRFNGKLNRFFDLNEFEPVFGKADSSKLMAEEEPCSYIFDNPDGSKEETDRYFYKDGSRFENSGTKMAVDEFRFMNGNFITYKGTVIDSRSTVEAIRKLFPNAVKRIGILDVYGEGKLQVIQLREDEQGVSDGHINLFFKNNKAYYIHWWFPC